MTILDMFSLFKVKNYCIIQKAVAFVLKWLTAHAIFWKNYQTWILPTYPLMMKDLYFYLFIPSSQSNRTPNHDLERKLSEEI